MKIGLIRCLQTEDMCPAYGCFRAVEHRIGAFMELDEDTEIHIGAVVTCGGCPGKKAVTRAETMINRGCDAIALATCISKGTPIEFPCPHFKEMKEAIQKRIGKDVTFFDFTH
ncbi:MAG: CGGC domain-containing protein [Lachnospiraceae bacterium]|nr:CGGC domain-containing protein [Lachnospiraceae bacterium]